MTTSPPPSTSSKDAAQLTVKDDTHSRRMSVESLIHHTPDSSIAYNKASSGATSDTDVSAPLPTSGMVGSPQDKTKPKPKPSHSRSRSYAKSPKFRMSPYIAMSLGTQFEHYQPEQLISTDISRPSTPSTPTSRSQVVLDSNSTSSRAFHTRAVSDPGPCMEEFPSSPTCSNPSESRPAVLASNTSATALQPETDAKGKRKAVSDDGYESSSPAKQPKVHPKMDPSGPYATKRQRDKEYQQDRRGTATKLMQNLCDMCNVTHGTTVEKTASIINYVNRLQDELVEKETEAQTFPELHQTIRDLEVEIKASKDMAYRMSASVHNDVTNAVRERDRYWQGLVEQRDHEIRRLKGEVMGVRDSWERVVAEKNEELEELRGSMEKAESLLYIALRKPSSA